LFAFIYIRYAAHQAVKFLANINFQWFHQALTTLISLRQPFLKMKVSSNGRRFKSVGEIKEKNSRAIDAKSVRVVDWNIGGKNEMSLDSVLVQEMTVLKRRQCLTKRSWYRLSFTLMSPGTLSHACSPALGKMAKRRALRSLPLHESL
jgi:hypothetical protein